MQNRLVLASSSPRRQALLKQVKIPHTVKVKEVDESVINIEDPQETVKQLAILKNQTMGTPYENEIILTADTVVSYKNEIFGKPKTAEEAFTMLKAMQGNIHEVYTGVMIRSLEKEIVFSEKTSVEFWNLSDEELNAYIETGDPFDKAGSYGIQSEGAVLVKRIIGDYFNVVGLPIARTVRELKRFDIYPVS
jgi:septum formation protein